MKAYKVMVVFFCFIRGRKRSDISESTGIRSGTVGELFAEFEKIFATEEFYYGAFLNETLARDEIEEVLSGVRGGMRQHVQTDETTWGAAKYGRGKPAHIGATQWFQTIAQIVNINGVEKIKSFAVFPVADRTRITLHANIYAVVPRGVKIRSDCFRSYLGLGAEFQHFTVNHSIGFVAPNGVHTNHIESFHRQLKDETLSRRSKMPTGEGRIYAVMASSSLYRCGRVSRDTYGSGDERTSVVSGDSRLACAFKIVRWMATEGVSVYKPNTAELSAISEANISLTVEADKMFAVISERAKSVRPPRNQTDSELRRYQLEFSTAIADAPTPTASQTGYQTGYHPDTRLPAPKRQRGERSSTPLRSASSAPSTAVSPAVRTPATRSRGRKTESAEFTFPQTPDDWDKLTDEQYERAKVEMEAARSRFNQVEHSWVLSRSRSNMGASARPELGAGRKDNSKPNENL